MKHPHVRAINLVYSFGCNAACRHCAYDDVLTTKQLPVRVVSRVFEECRQEGIARYGITGGEPFLYPDKLVEIAGIGKQCGLHGSVITNGSWGNDGPRAGRTVRALFRSGISRMTISFDPFHEEYVDFESIVAAYRICHETGMTVRVRVAAGNPLSMADISVIRRLTREKIRHEIIACSPFGRARSLDPSRMRRPPAIPSLKRGCRDALSPVIYPDGRVYLCCLAASQSERGRYYAGNVSREPLKDVLRRSRSDPAFSLIRERGPVHAHAELTEQMFRCGYTFKAPGADHPCELCFNVMRLSETMHSLRTTAA